ncbi:hypothetical protein Gasu2_04490 [Galdieria sulphuraria]|nr:hypothetical protein Gasu2_04490 [Galdieria sulphuraria]
MESPYALSTKGIISSRLGLYRKCHEIQMDKLGFEDVDSFWYHMNRKRTKTKSVVSTQNQCSTSRYEHAYSLQKINQFPQKEKFTIFEDEESKNDRSTTLSDTSAKKLQKTTLHDTNLNKIQYTYEKQKECHKARRVTGSQNLFDTVKVCSETISENQVLNHKEVQTKWVSTPSEQLKLQGLYGTKLGSLIIRSSQLQYTKFKAKYSPSYRDGEELIPLEAYPSTEVSIQVAVAFDNAMFRSGLIRLSRAAETIPQRATKGFEVFSIVSGSVEVTIRNVSFQLEEDDQFCIPQDESYILRNLEKTAESICCFFLAKTPTECT